MDIDEYFVYLLYKLDIQQRMDCGIQTRGLRAYTELIDHFRVAKQKFWSCEHDKYDKWNGLDFAKQWRWGLRQRIALMSDKWHNCDLETFVEETDIFDKGILSTKNKAQTFMVLEDGYLRLNYFVWTHDPILNRVVWQSHRSYLESLHVFVERYNNEEWVQLHVFGGRAGQQ